MLSKKKIKGENMDKELFEKFITLAKEKGFAPNLDEVNYETAKQLTELNKNQN